MPNSCFWNRVVSALTARNRGRHLHNHLLKAVIGHLGYVGQLLGVFPAAGAGAKLYEANFRPPKFTLKFFSKSEKTEHPILCRIWFWVEWRSLFCSYDFSSCRNSSLKSPNLVTFSGPSLYMRAVGFWIFEFWIFGKERIFRSAQTL